MLMIFDVVFFEHRENQGISNFSLGFCFSLDEVGNECPHSIQRYYV